MKITKRDFIAGAGAALAAPAVLGGSANAQAVTTLRFHHFLPAVSNMHTKVILPWAKKVSDASGGKLQIQVFPSMQLGGTPPQLFDQAKDGVVDIVWTLPGSTPGRFPSTEVFELPFIADRRGIVNARAAQEFAATRLTDETKDVKLLAFWAHDRGLIHTKKPVAKLEDLKGMKIRFATRLVGEAFKSVGIAAIGMPVTQIPESLAQGVLDGAGVPWEVVPSIKLAELAKYHTDIPGNPTLFTACFFIVMNKAKYEGLPPDLKKVIDDLSGMPLAEMAGNMWDAAGAEVEAQVKARSGNTYTVLSQEEANKWIEATKPVYTEWVNGLKAKNLDGAKLIEEAKALLAKHGKA